MLEYLFNSNYNRVKLYLENCKPPIKDLELALCLATQNNQIDFVKLILDNLPKKSTDVDNIINIALGYAVRHSSGNDLSIIKLLISHGAIITDDLLGDVGNDVEMAQFLLDNGARPTKESRALAIALQNGQNSVYTFLLNLE